ncbi:MAG: hypothetical protein WD512_02940, partial [Candidatus Paceibacterota bacterium]
MPTIANLVEELQQRNTKWWKNQEIRLYWEPDIQASTVAIVMKEIYTLCQTIGINFDLITYGKHPSSILESVMHNGHIDYNLLFNLVQMEPSRDETIGGREHGDIFITSSKLLNDPVSLGRASYFHGCMVLCLYDRSQYYYNVLRRLALHQMTHLLGLPYHCDKFLVDGYSEYELCNMHYALPSGETCPKCMDFLRHFWQNHRI